MRAKEIHGPIFLQFWGIKLYNAERKIRNKLYVIFLPFIVSRVCFKFCRICFIKFPKGDLCSKYL